MRRNNDVVARELDKRPEHNLPAKPEFAKNVEWIIADQSGSMGESVGPTKLGDWHVAKGQRRIDKLNEAINAYGEHIQTISFSDNTELHKGHVSLEPIGGTNLTKALIQVQEYEPNYIIVISDGCVNDSTSSLTEGERIGKTCIIDTLYIGPNNETAEKFMRDLAALGNGRFKRYDITKPQQLSLTQVMQGLLPAPGEVIET